MTQSSISRFLSVFFVAVFLSLVFSSLSADEIVRTEDGRKIRLKDDGTYTIIENHWNENEIISISFGDLIFEGSDLIGETVKVKGSILFEYFNNNAHGNLFNDKQATGQIISLDYSEANKALIRRMLNNCPGTCKAVVTGRVQKGSFPSTLGLKVRSIKITRY